MKRIGLALGGGFVRGAAHIGVLKVLEAEGIRPAAVAGTSAGSIVAALYAAGYTAAEMERVALALEPKKVFDGGPVLRLVSLWRVLAALLRRRRGRIDVSAPLGLLPGAALEAFLKELFGARRFDELPLPLLITATDVAGGRRVVFGPSPLVRDAFVRPARVPVARAVRASCAVPGLFEPVRWEDMVLVDGGVREAVPAEAVRLAGVEVVVAVDVGGRGAARRPVKDILDLVSEAWELSLTEGKRKELEAHADLVLAPAVGNVQPWDFDRIPHCIRAGEEAACDGLHELREVLA
ncbi:MAG: patatin-like phospholipase family protein [Bacillota bacterium]